MRHSFLLLLIGFAICVPAYGQTPDPNALRALPDNLVLPSKPTPKDKTTYKTLWRACKTKSVAFCKRCKPTAENLVLNWEDTKKMVRSSGPYLQPVASATGILFNLNNYRINGGN